MSAGEASCGWSHIGNVSSNGEDKTASEAAGVGGGVRSSPPLAPPPFPFLPQLVQPLRAPVFFPPGCALFYKVLLKKQIFNKLY